MFRGVEAGDVILVYTAGGQLTFRKMARSNAEPISLQSKEAGTHNVVILKKNGKQVQGKIVLKK